MLHKTSTNNQLQTLACYWGSSWGSPFCNKHSLSQLFKNKQKCWTLGSVSPLLFHHCKSYSSAWLLLIHVITNHSLSRVFYCTVICCNLCRMAYNFLLSFCLLYMGSQPSIWYALQKDMLVYVIWLHVNNHRQQVQPPSTSFRNNSNMQHLLSSHFLNIPTSWITISC